MTVRFNTRAVQDTVEARVEPIGVEGDASSNLPGGVTEAEAIVEAAKRTMPSVEEGAAEPSIESTSQDARPQEPQPTLAVDALEKAKQKAQEGQAAVADGR
jgi:protein phosphatase PTC1